MQRADFSDQLASDEAFFQAFFAPFLASFLAPFDTDAFSNAHDDSGGIWVLGRVYPCGELLQVQVRCGVCRVDKEDLQEIPRICEAQ